jgi:hypothetical protein
MTPTLPGKAAPEAVVSRLLWREQFTALPRAGWHALRRLVRREPRWYLVIDGQVVARMVSQQDHLDLLAWIAATHEETFRVGEQFGLEVRSAVDRIQQADAGDVSTP